VVSQRQADLEEARDLLRAAMLEVDAKDLPRVVRELRAVNADLEALAPSVSAGQRLKDELRERRAARRPAS
jgi:hypothetical protein